VIVVSSNVKSKHQMKSFGTEMKRIGPALLERWSLPMPDSIKKLKKAPIVQSDINEERLQASWEREGLSGWISELDQQLKNKDLAIQKS